MAAVAVGIRGWAGGAWGVEAWNTPTPTTFFSPSLLSLNSVALSTDNNNIAVTGQNLNLTESSVTLTTEQRLATTGQSLTLTERSVVLSTEQILSIVGQALTLSESYVDIISVNSIFVSGQLLVATLNNATIDISVFPTALGQSLTLQLNEPKFWFPVNTEQVPNWQPVNDIASTLWTTINTNQNPEWVDIPH